VVALVAAGATPGAQDLQGNSAAHLALLAVPGEEVQHPAPLEDLVPEAAVLAQLRGLGLPGPALHQLCLAAFLLRSSVMRLC
jgi:hypothetical protein